MNTPPTRLAKRRWHARRALPLTVGHCNDIARSTDLNSVLATTRTRWVKRINRPRMPAHTLNHLKTQEAHHAH
jgi:hypothetical protein